jgi:uncharacterized protein YdcH (DUF465 family)
MSTLQRTPQAPVVTPPAAPSAPTVGAEQAAPVVAAPVTAQDVIGVRAKLNELNRQLAILTSRRNDLARQIRRVDGATRSGIEARVTQLDKQILQLDQEISETGRQLASARPELLTSTQPPPSFGQPRPRFDPTPVGIAFTMFVFAPIAFAAARLMWKRGTSAHTSAPVPNDLGDRLTRIEQAVDAIAIEVERVSEGQRFVTRVMTESSAARALNAGEAPMEPLRVPDREAVRRSS